MEFLPSCHCSTLLSDQHPALSTSLSGHLAITDHHRQHAHLLVVAGPPASRGLLLPPFLITNLTLEW